MNGSASLAVALGDLEVAERAVARMSVATQFPAFHEAWQDFLFRMERAWEHAERAIKSEKGFQQWFKPYAQLRRRDPLLLFLAHARNAETHAVCPTIDKPIKVMVRDKRGIPFSIESIKSTLEDGVLTIDVDTAAQDSLLDYEAHILPGAPTLVRFRDRGMWYETPQSHLKKPIRGLHPVDAARLAVEFYKGFIKEAEFRFARRLPAKSVTTDD